MSSRKPRRRPSAAASSSGGNARKTRQLCAQVARTVEAVLVGELDDEVLRELIVHKVEPAPDESRLLGEAPAAMSYLNIERVVAAAKATGCDAVHPGYGFLSENPEFAAAVEAAGLTFVGPTAASMRLMGNKTAARKEAVAAGVPTVEGGTEPLRDLEDLRARARATSFPLVLKAARGGGYRRRASDAQA